MRQPVFHLVRLAICLSLIFSGCATMMTGRTQQVVITSNPSGAIVKIDEKELKTPATVTLSKKTSYIAAIEKPGFESVVVEIRRRPSWWNLLDVAWVYLLPVPLIYDINTGGFWVFLENTFHVDLKPESAETLFSGTPPVKKSESDQEPPSWSGEISIIPVVMPVPVSPFPERLAVVAESTTSGHPFLAWLDVALNFLRKRHPAMVIMERDASQFITNEASSQYSGRFDEESTVRMGRLVGADTLLTYRLEPFPEETLEIRAKHGGDISGEVEMRLLHVESGLTTFRQSGVATVKIASPKEGMTWPKDLVHLAHRKAVKKATSYVLAALVTAFGDNPLGLVPSLATPGEGVMVEGVLNGGPADQADLKKGDRILMIDGRPLVDWTTRVSLPATLTIERDGKREQVILKSDFD
ncbi:MAG: PDZ domain-containing protein [Nitrospirota bacterium]|nr:PDZ domain-containing protein [Nitrospirota bacterium]MDH4361621.1 PDZ domain-containing protein [Nitrospirota bacterium]